MSKLKNILETKDLCIGYFSKKQNRIIANDLNIALQQGGLVCILGKNGIGKSTLLRTLTKVQPKLSGEIILKNKNLENHSAVDLAKSISLVLKVMLVVIKYHCQLIMMGR